MQPLFAYLSQRRAVLCLFLVSLVLHFIRLGQPGEVVFDEVLVGHFSAQYFSGHYYFDIHPPLTKLIYALMAWLGGMDPSFTFAANGIAYPGNFYLWMRGLPALAGSVLPVLVYALSREMGVQRLWALVAGWLVLFDSALMVESRFILNDILLLTYGVTGWWAFAIWRRTHKWPWLLAAGLGFGMALSVKWTGLGFIAPAGVVWLYDFSRKPNARSLGAALVLIAVPLAIQLTGFVVHLSLLPQSGTGEAFMTPAFQKRLIGNQHQDDPMVDALSLPGAILEVNHAMAQYAGQMATHPYGSKWYTWPLGWRGIYVWNDDKATDGRVARIYLFPNVVTWWLAAFGIVYLLINLLPRVVAALTGRQHQHIDRVELVLAMAYLANLLPFVPIDRVMFLYH
ncbi:MAG: phospholipid carrier-dependent glycosyltransferase, partial [Burkholderiales bacterium]|nr:phospholipid carrier-dependent glycosyltransferase [Burkholderiales bacterium]